MRVHAAYGRPVMTGGVGGARRDRTDDLLLAKQALSQLSYGPAMVSYGPVPDGGAARNRLSGGPG